MSSLWRCGWYADTTTRPFPSLIALAVTKINHLGCARGLLQPGAPVVPSRTRPRRRRWAPQSGPCASWNGPYGRPGNRSSDHRSKLGRQASTVYARAVEIPAFDRMAEPEVATLAGRPKWAPPGRPKLGCVADSYVDRRTVAARCPGCAYWFASGPRSSSRKRTPSTREVAVRLLRERHLSAPPDRLYAGSRRTELPGRGPGAARKAQEWR